MRSLKYLSAVLPLHFLNAYATRPGDADTTVIVTSTRTITICPITELFTCEADILPSTTTSKGVSASSILSYVSASTTSHIGSNGTSSIYSGTTSSYSGTTSSYSGSSTLTTTSGFGGDGTTSSYSGYTTSSTTSGFGGNGTTSLNSGYTTSSTTSGFVGNGTTSSNSGYTTSSTTSGLGGNATTSSNSGYTTSSTTSGLGGNATTSSNSGYTTSTTTSAFGGNGTTTSHSGNLTSTTTSFTSSVTTSAGNTTTTTTTTTQCQNSTATATGLPEPRCNDANNRKKWCDGKSVDYDTHNDYKSGNTKKYSLTITNENIDSDGSGAQPVFAINGKTPGEAIIANWGDMLEVTVTNLLTDNATTIHWHGIRQYGSNDQDGVPGVTECGIAPGTSRTYKFLASTYGTGWYHSHAMAQYGGGIRGPIIIHGPATEDYDLDMGTVMINEKFTQTIFQMAYNIARVRGALPPSANYLLNGKNKSPSGSTGESEKWTVKAGKKHLFRIINSSAQTAYAVHFDNHKMKVIGADFTPITPYETETLWIQSGQRYNVVVEMNQPKGAYYLRAVTQTGCGVQCANDGLGSSNGVFEYEGSCTTPTTPSNLTIVTAGDCKDEPLASLKPYVNKDAGSSSKFQSTVKLLPGGNAAAQNFDGFGSVIRWYLGGTQDLAGNSANVRADKAINVTFGQPTLKTLATLPDLSYNSSIYSNAVVLDGPKNDWVYFVIQNNFQTSHPMHLHGHDFSVLGQGRGIFTSDMVSQLSFDNPIRRDTALLFGIGSPTAFTSGWTVIGFQTDNPGAWLMHCHIIWHADGGMGLQYLERPSEIGAAAYANSQSFTDECSAYNQYEANGGAQKTPYESGLKMKRHLEDHKFHGYAHGNVVRDSI